MSKFSGIIKGIVADAGKVKAAVLKAISEVDNVVLPEAEKIQPLVDAVADATVPGSGKFVDLALTWLEESASALDAGGAALEKNLTDAGADTTAIAAVKAILPELKAATATTAAAARATPATS